MSRSVVGRIARSASLFIAGLLAASVMSGSVVAAPASVNATLTRVTSCAGLDFHPIDSDTTFRWSNRLLWRANADGDGWYMCDPGLPNKATVTKVRFTIKDGSEYAELRGCSLVRSGLTSSSSSSGQAVAIATVGDTGVSAKPGTVRRSTTSISHATLDESSYAYYLQCQIALKSGVDGVSSNAGIIGADVTYRISSTNG